MMIVDDNNNYVQTEGVRLFFFGFLSLPLVSPCLSPLLSLSGGWRIHQVNRTSISHAWPAAGLADRMRSGQRAAPKTTPHTSWTSVR